ncbi:MAG: hypothetical protein LH603_14325, partial [Pseudonocardia sp.]|nr:hypothetical protein [Pseudonocardia sp.]
MPDRTSADGLDAVAEHLYALRPDEFVPARDDAVTRARSDGDPQLARAIGRLRRPTRAAWLANLLATRRTEQLDGLLALATDLADAQRTLDGATLRALSSQRNRLVAAMAREAGRLAREAGDSATDPMLRDLAGILEAALADPAVADEVRSGRLTRTVSYSGFGPADPDAVPARREATARPRSVPDTDTGQGHGGPGADGTGQDGTEQDGTQPDGTQPDSTQPDSTQPDSTQPDSTQPDSAERSGAEQDGPGKGQERAEQERADRRRAEQERADRERRDRERAGRERAVADAEQEEAAARERHEDAEAARGDAEAAHNAARDHVAVLTTELDAARARERAAA